MINSEKKILESHPLTIVGEIWKEVKAISRRKQLRKSQSEILAEMLKRFAAGNVEIGQSYDLKNKKITRVKMESSDWEMYNNLAPGSRAEVVNSLLKIWIEENS